MLRVNHTFREMGLDLANTGILSWADDCAVEAYNLFQTVIFFVVLMLLVLFVVS
jgi:hypothetical protein